MICHINQKIDNNSKGRLKLIHTLSFYLIRNIKFDLLFCLFAFLFYLLVIYLEIIGLTHHWFKASQILVLKILL